MSYSFQFTAPDKASAKEQARVKMAEVVHSQPPHAFDEAHAVANAHAQIDLLPDDARRAIAVSMNGYVSIEYGASLEDMTLTGVSVNCSVSLVAKPQEAA